jgi:hypothetical protein
VCGQVASWAKRKLPKRLNRLLPKTEYITEAISESFIKTHEVNLPAAWPPAMAYGPLRGCSDPSDPHVALPACAALRI